MPSKNPLFDCVLLTNDDGIHAPGLSVLEKIATELSREVWVVAPAHDQSGVSHATSIHEPLRVEELGERRFAVRGTPGDCVILAVKHLMSRRPSLILSGINRGANIGIETIFSGTVGAAMSGMLLEVPSIAISQAISPQTPVMWDTALSTGPSVLMEACEAPWARNCCLNINLPACSPGKFRGISFTAQGRGRLNDGEVHARRDPRNQEYFWLNLARTDNQDDAGTETFGVLNGYATVTPLSFERTHSAALIAMTDRQND
ncbi:5'/3'-nucleotidase SurE [Pseudomonas syringae]|uniref:5'/3'-nucleotidase SurE n=1 Tax=Pseudomonas sp. MWU16-30316 TaxID=2878093 RepID=UPI001103FC84|nr:5'/3'-nucleotidase SurE [Pseudomonas sp. MWU16-30316]TFZ34274.1 5'/3'-nucleotidase SurE [Pseudomonas syringae]